jgi:hypothetical protein
MQEFDLSSASSTAALFIVAICAYKHDREECYSMIDILKGPQKLSVIDKNFIRDRMMVKSDYIGEAYFNGATPENNYTPSLPYTVSLIDGPYSYVEDGFATLYIKTKGADSARPVKLRKKGDDWYLWEFAAVLADIRKPHAEDPWK